MPECIITGCELVDPEHGRWIHGDLHEDGSVYVFVGCVKLNGQISWQYDPVPNSSKQLILNTHKPFFESRGVIVIPKDLAHLNAIAREYVYGQA